MYGLENFLSILAYRTVYDYSLESFPSAYLLLSSSLVTATMLISSFLYTQKSLFEAKEEEEENQKRRLD